MWCYENTDRFKKEGLKPHQILISTTKEIVDYEEVKMILVTGLDDLQNLREFLVLEGFHNSDCDFDDIKWEGIVYLKEELIGLTKADYNKNDLFWQAIKKYFCREDLIL